MVTAMLLLGFLAPDMQSSTSASSTRFVKSADGSRIAYEVAGSGPTILLLRGQTRRVWHDAGYVGRLSPSFTVITIDLRGNGESDKPTAKSAYAVERLVEDLLSLDSRPT